MDELMIKIGPEFTRRKFIVVCHPRTGSNLLCHMLAERTDIRYMGEFYPDFRFIEPNFIHELFYGGTSRIWPSPYLMWPYSPDNRYAPDRSHIGCYAKIFYYLLVNSSSSGHWLWPRPWDLGWRGSNEPRVRMDVLDYLEEQKLGIIHMKRANILDTALSFIRASTENNFFARHYDGALEIRPEILEFNLWLVSHHMACLDRALQNRPHLDVWYDDLVDDPQKISDQVANYVGLSWRKAIVAEKTIRQRQGSQRDNIANYEELKQHFACGEYARFFEN